jgi:hypothetical protein
MRKAVAPFAALFIAGCASSEWQATETVPDGKLYVPKMYAPLRPGSIYPDRKTPVPAKGRPLLVLVCPESGDCRKDEILDQAAQRGLVVLATKQQAPSIPARSEIDATRTGTLMVAAASLKLVASPPPRAGTPPSSPSQQSPSLFATLHTTAPPAGTDGVILKLYAPDEKGRLPREAFRDAVEWLAGELGAR